MTGVWVYPLGCMLWSCGVVFCHLTGPSAHSIALSLKAPKSRSALLVTEVTHEFSSCPRLCGTTSALTFWLSGLHMCVLLELDSCKLHSQGSLVGFNQLAMLFFMRSVLSTLTQHEGCHTMGMSPSACCVFSVHLFHSFISPFWSYLD